MSTTIQLDKRLTRDLDDLGTIDIRVVVVPKKAEGNEVEIPDEDDDFALAIGKGKSPIDSYLERADGRGKMCVLFQLNGHRQDALDQVFIAKDLGFRYLRNRMLILVELDGLHQRALNKMLKGDRVGLFRGDVFLAIRKRIIDTLEEDPDLKRLQTEAEEQVAELDSGSEAIRKKLDQLIEEHHKTDDPTNAPLPPGGQAALRFGAPKTQMVVVEHAGGPPVLGPLLEAGGPQTLRMRPNAERTVDVCSAPSDAWSMLEGLSVRLDPPVEELSWQSEDLDGGGKRITVRFDEPAGADDDQYPVETKLQVLAKFAGYSEPRLIEKNIIVSPPANRPKPTPPPLLADPTSLAVVSRQPVKLIPGGATAHVRMRWDGKDELTAGAAPTWQVRARCTTLSTFPKINYTQPHSGRFELLIDTPRSLLPTQKLEFLVEAVGPSGKILSAKLVARLEAPEVEDPDKPGMRKRKVAEIQAVPTRPYEFKLIGEDDWDSTPYWNKPMWDANSVGCFVPPSKGDPLILVVNKDYEPLKAACASMVKNKGYVESTIEERRTKYFTHVGVHLYAMFRFRKELEKLPEADADYSPTAMDEFMESEIERTAGTVLHLLT